MNNVFIDVIINCYNDAELLPDALDSVLRQSYYVRIQKIIVMDDGSTDATPAVVNKYSDPKIVHVYQKNRWLAHARNTAFSHCSAPYIAFLDADDVWVDNKLECQISVLEQNSKIDLLYSNVMAFYGTWPRASYEYFTSRAYQGKGNLEEFYTFDGPIYPSTVIMKSSLFEELDGFDDQFFKSEDTELWLRVMATGYVEYMSDFTVYRRLSLTSLGGDLEVLLPYQRKIEEKICKEYPSLKELTGQRHSEQYYTSAKEKITKFGQPQKARSFLWQYLKRNPLSCEGWGLFIFSLLPFVSKPKYSNVIKQWYKRARGF